MNISNHKVFTSKNIINKYKVIKLIGIGGMSKVFLVQQIDTQKTYALKYRNNDDNQNNKIRFIRELELLRKINSKNIPKIYSWHIDEDEQFFVMEYIEGETLNNIIKKNGFLHERIALNYIKQISSAIKELHDLNIIHRDIKSQNILVSKNQVIKVIDLGISITSDTLDLRLTREQSIVGSVYYVAPELIKNNKNISVQSDIYSLGILFFEMLSGKYPFDNEDIIMTLYMHKNNPFPRITKIRELPFSLENVIYNATHKNPNYRYASVSDFIKDLSTCLDKARSSEKSLYEKEIQQNTQIGSFLKSTKFLVILSVSVFVMLVALIVAILII
ncbi:serine/threonine-protein kinase [Mycoplasmopsis ciconiae]|uniref:Serine/threonine-protein kinase n=1 Tax=Mycoplasmopsis ciconiae TaxID=561067 RepID=A0ABU7ML23_9BACT|nr:serine/threonine-protein kinase [Mycoplasmopsis ciconiae]